MVKFQMNSADVAAEVKCLQHLVGARCSNIYDISPRKYLFKLEKSSGVSESREKEKTMLLMESGIRLHSTVHEREKSNVPSVFTVKLRKHIKKKKLEAVRQIGYDRIVSFQFGNDEHTHYLILELYAQGNIILADSNFMVLTLLRSHRDDDQGLAIMSRHTYPVKSCRTFERTSSEKLKAALTCPEEPVETKFVDGSAQVNDGSDVSWEIMGDRKMSKKSNKKVKARSKQPTLKSVLAKALNYGPVLLEHIILDAGLTPNAQIGKNFQLEFGTLELLLDAVSKFEDWVEEVISGDKIPEGFIVLQQSDSVKEDASLSNTEGSGQIYDDYCPLLLTQFKLREYTSFATFDAALDEFYSKIEIQRAETKLKAKETSAMRKLAKSRMDQENRLLSLEKEVDHCCKMGKLIEYNSEAVDAAILAVRVMLANGLSWKDVDLLVKEEKNTGSSCLIDNLDLEGNCMTLLLSNKIDERIDDEKTQPVDKVVVDLQLTALANAGKWYDKKQQLESKHQRTVAAHELAAKAAERKTRLQLSQEKTVAEVTRNRKVHWFEEFYWFKGFGNYLVISGRDAQQNEWIVKKYMSEGDVCVHADLDGAPITVIKNHKPEAEVPPRTLEQAGCFTLCHSKAWGSKSINGIRPWWVYPHQVNKTASTGKCLEVGISVFKNYLPSPALTMGFGVLFCLDESSLGAHSNEGIVRGKEKELKESLREISESNSEKGVSDVKHASGVPSAANSSDGSDVLGDHADSSLHNHSLDSDDAVSEYAENSSTSVSAQLEDLFDRALEIGSAKIHGGSETSVESVGEHHHKISETKGRDKSYMSKAQRKMLKKGPKDAVVGPNMGDGKGEAEGNHDYATELEESLETSKIGGGKSSRGQRSRLKKIKKKYGDQDEEERSIRMSLLAAAGKGHKNNKVADVSGLVNSRKVCFKCKKPGHCSRDCHEDTDGVRGTPDGLEEKRDASLSYFANDTDRTAMDEDNFLEIGEEEIDVCRCFTGNPTPNDVLLYALPVCGPYDALQQYKYHVKLTAGTRSKVKAAREAKNLFKGMAQATKREIDLMKACRDEEFANVMRSKVILTAPGLSRMKQHQKESKKLKATAAGPSPSGKGKATAAAGSSQVKKTKKKGKK